MKRHHTHGNHVNLVEVLTERLAAHQLAALREPRLTARDMAVDMVQAMARGDLGAVITIIEKVHRLEARIDEPEGPADRRAIRRAQ